MDVFKVRKELIDALLPVNCINNYKEECRDESSNLMKCYSNTCLLNIDSSVAKDISEKGCEIYKKVYTKTMTQEEFYKKTDECIARFKNGKERYKTSVTFNKVVQMLVRDVDPYEIIDLLCQMSDDQTKAFEQYVLRHYHPTV